MLKLTENMDSLLNFSYEDALDRVTEQSYIESKEVCNYSQRNEIPAQHGIYTVQETDTAKTLYIGSCGQFKNDGSLTKQTLRGRFAVGHSPRRFSIKEGFFGINPIHNVKTIDRDRLADTREIYTLTWDLDKVQLKIFSLQCRQAPSPIFFERWLLTSYFNSHQSLPIGNSN